MAPADLTGEVTDLLQQLIRNRCVNDGTPASGHEVRSVDLLESYLRFPGAELKRYEPVPGRASLVLRIPGSDPRAPTLHFMGHTDVVPVTPSGWRHDPFAGELIDGEVWGRGAVDMLDITSSMAVAVRRLMESDFRPKGTLVYSAVADEEAMGTFGAQWLVENAWNDVRCEYLVTEFGGARLPLRGTIKLPIMTSEKGSHWVRLRMRGTPGHGSLPYQSDNALVKVAELATRIARYKAPLRLSDLWKRFIERLELAAPARLGLTNPATFDIALKGAPEGAAGLFYSATRTTFSPNVVQAGVKTNVIPDSAELYVDVRTVAGDEGPEVRKMLREAAGEQLWRDVEIVDEGENPATQSPISSPLWDALTRVTQRLVPGSETVPFIFVAATDARFFRRKGVTAYGYGLRSDRISLREFFRMFHGNDERIDQESLRLSTLLWEETARLFLG